MKPREKMKEYKEKNIYMKVFYVTSVKSQSNEPHKWVNIL
jgi:hypothetical protein